MKKITTLYFQKNEQGANQSNKAEKQSHDRLPLMRMKSKFDFASKSAIHLNSQGRRTLQVKEH